jgi:hypothetical protein
VEAITAEVVVLLRGGVAIADDLPAPIIFVSLFDRAATVFTVCLLELDKRGDDGALAAESL